jgi:hypothetical protein
LQLNTAKLLIRADDNLWILVIIIKTLPLLFLAFFIPKVYAISPIVPKQPIASPRAESSHQWHVYTPAEIDELLQDTANPVILKKLISCESQDTNIARMDSNHQISYGLLQFNGTATWQEFSALANVSGSPMIPDDAVKVADWMISNGALGRWTCAHILKLIK